MRLNASSNFSRETKSNSVIACCVSAIDLQQISRSRVRNVNLCSHSLYSFERHHVHRASTRPAPSSPEKFVSAMANSSREERRICRDQSSGCRSLRSCKSECRRIIRALSTPHGFAAHAFLQCSAPLRKRSSICRDARPPALHSAQLALPGLQTHYRANSPNCCASSRSASPAPRSSLMAGSC